MVRNHDVSASKMVPIKFFQVAAGKGTWHYRIALHPDWFNHITHTVSITCKQNGSVSNSKNVR